MTEKTLTPVLEKYLTEVIHPFQPKAKVVWKDESTFMKVLFYVSLMVFWNPRFMTSYTTVIGSTIYVARESWTAKPEISKLATLMHEGAHMYDNKQNPLWQVAYLFPQVLFAVLGIGLAFVSPWFFLLFLGVALPLPAPWRFLYEVRAYRLNLMFCRRVLGYDTNSAEYKDYYASIVAQMTDQWYFFAMPFKRIVEGELHKWDGNDPYVREATGWLHKEAYIIT